MIHPEGSIKAKDFVAILPMVDTTVVLECTGKQVRCDCAAILRLCAAMVRRVAGTRRSRRA
jgi:hypothetical protein